MPELGRAALLVTLGLSLYALLAGAYAAFHGRRRLARSAQNALVAAFVSTAGTRAPNARLATAPRGRWRRDRAPFRGLAAFEVRPGRQR